MLGLAVGGIILSFLAYRIAERADLERVTSVLDLRAQWRARDFEQRLLLTAEAAESLAAFVATEQPLTAERFHRFARLAHANDDFDSAIYWSPWVPGPERARFVATARAEVRPDYDIREISPDNRFVPAAARDDYLPMLYEESFDNMPGVTGFDLMFRPARRVQVERARDEGRPGATPPFAFLIGGKRVPGFLILWPVYNTDELPGTVEARRAAFRGLITARFRLDHFLSGSIAHTPEIVERIEIAIGAPGSPAQHAADYDPASKTFNFAETASSAPAGSVVLAREFTVLGQHWLLTSYFLPATVVQLEPNSRSVWLLFGLLTTTVLCLFLWRLMARLGVAESTVVRNAMRLQAVMDNSVDGLITIDAAGIVTGFSRPAERLFGYTADAVVGKNISMLMSEPDRSAHDRYIANFLSSGTAKIIGIGREVVARRRDGSTFPMDLAVGEIPNPQGRREFVGSVRDITSRRQAEVAQAALAEQFRRLFDDNPIGMVLATADEFRFVRVNAAFCAMLGYAPEELIGHSRDEFVAPDSINMPQPNEAADQGWHPIDKHFIHKSGNVVAARVRVLRLPTGAEGEQLVLGIAIAVTDQRRLEASLRQAQKMEAIGNLTGGMAHDFNNLLGVIIGNLDLAHAGVEQPGELSELVDEALAAALRGADLTRSLLAFARRQPLQPRSIAVNDQVADITRLLRRTLGEQFQITLNLGVEVWPVVADPAQLEASIVNLATNARDAMPDGGRLTIATGNRSLDADYAATNPEVTPGDYAMIEVSDTGTGMTKAVTAQIFEPFFTTKERGKGTGLGLSMVFGFVKQSGGHISVYSEPGIGTTFRLYFPRSENAASAAATALEAQPAIITGEKVLLVEDNAPLRRIAARQLSDLGYVVREADSAQAALEMLKQEGADLLFTDIVMPGTMDGYALAREALARWPRIKVLLTSGFPETRIHGKLGASATAARLLIKPYRKGELARVLREALEG